MHACMHTHLWRHPLVDAAHDGGQEACLQIRRWHEPLPGYKALKVFAALHQGGGPTAGHAGQAAAAAAAVVLYPMEHRSGSEDA